MNSYGYASHQYATDIGWAVKQTTRMAQMLSTLTQFTLLYDIPVYE
jgi:beta-N-acetylglucosaminidase